jgi:hypothetical protein
MGIALLFFYFTDYTPSTKKNLHGLTAETTHSSSEKAYLYAGYSLRSAELFRTIEYVQDLALIETGHISTS